VVPGADAVVCVGIEEYEAARAALPQQRIELIPGGVDPDRAGGGDPLLGRQRLDLDGDRPIIACIARLDAQKDQVTLAKAWATLREPCDLALVGAETTPGYRAAIEAAIRGATCPGQFRLTGNVPTDQIPHLLAAADIIALPSRHEPFGLAILEAWAAGKPVVAGNTGGPAWLLRQGGGLLAAVGDAADFARHLRTLLQDPSLRARMGAEGHDLMRQQHTWDHHHRKLVALYQSLTPALGGGNPA
jgi:glycosyltransferase involved in cell wall biosynthesis